MALKGPLTHDQFVPYSSPDFSVFEYWEQIWRIPNREGLPRHNASESIYTT